MATDETRIESLFFAALEHADPSARQAFLRDACRGNDQLRQRVERLIDAHPKAQQFLDQPAFDAADLTRAQIVERPGTVIGRYKLLQVIGEGGFGVVFMAEQTEPVRRQVALKIIKPGMDTRQVVARFEAERQALALMEHPNIAKVFDGGATESGRPYFVMELVRGVPITEYCDAHDVPLRDRLQLFVDLCRALQHAHQKGVIHRDLKPSNVMVTLHDGEPVVKIIDFGIAKATGRRLTDKTVFTGFAQLVGTPLYMSPEQAEWSGLDVDTRSDIYSLGVLLYELLTGTTPFERERLGRAALDEIRRIIREEEPPKPSTRISTLGERLTDVAAHRKTEPARLGRLMRGDLDWLVMKALEKDRNRRYETASAFARDIERYLADEPVEARAPSAAYRFGKFARRHKAPIAAAAAIVLALILGAVAATWQAVRATRAEALAQKRYQDERQARREADEARLAAVAAQIEANQETEKAKVIAQVLTQMLAPAPGLSARESGAADPPTVPPAAAPGAGGDVSRIGLDHLIQYARTAPIEDASEKIQFAQKVALIRLMSGDRDGALRLARETFDLYKGTTDPAVACALLSASVLLPDTFTDPVAADRVCEVAMRYKAPDWMLRDKPAQEVERLEEGYRHAIVAAVRYRQGRYQEALNLLEPAVVKAVLTARKNDGDLEHVTMYRLLDNYKTPAPLRLLGRMPRHYFRRALAGDLLRETIDERFLDVVFLAMARHQIGDIEGAQAYLAAARDDLTDLASNDYAWGFGNQTKWWERQRMHTLLAEAEGLVGNAPDVTQRALDDLLAHARKQEIADDYQAARYWYGLAVVRLSNGDAEGARRVAREAFERFKDTNDLDAAVTILRACSLVDDVIADSGAIDRLYENALKLDKTPGEDSWFDATEQLAHIRYRQGRYAEVIDLLKDQRPLEEIAELFLAMSHHHLGNFNEAQTMLADWGSSSSWESLGYEWVDWQRLRLMHAEAVALILSRKLDDAAIESLIAHARTVRESDDIIDALFWYELAMQRITVGDLRGARRTIDEIVREFARTTDAKAARLAIRACVLLPGIVDDSEAINRLIDLAMKADTKWFDEAAIEREMGMLRFRQGRYTEALKLFKDVEPNKPDPEEHLFLAMTHHHLGHDKEARELLESARENAVRYFQSEDPLTDDNYHWMKRSMFAMLLREAETLINAESAKP